MNPVIVPDSVAKVTFKNGEVKQGLTGRVYDDGFILGEEYVKFEDVQTVFHLSEKFEDFLKRKCACSSVE